MQRSVAQLQLVQSILKIFVPPRAKSAFRESESHPQHTQRQSAFFREKTNKTKNVTNLKQNGCVFLFAEWI